MSGIIQPLLGYGAAVAPPAPTWLEVDGGIFLGDPVLGLAILDATHAVALSSAGDAGWTADAGETWNNEVLPLGAGTSFADVAAGNGMYVARYFTALSVQALARSTDGGATWADVTPVGAGVGPIFFAASAATFFMFDQDGTRVWVSALGATWADTALPVTFQITFGYPPTLEQAGALYAVGPGVGTAQYVLTSTNAATWTVAQNVSVPGGTYLNIAYDGTVFDGIVQGLVNNINYSSPDGVTWTTRVTGTPPWGSGQIGFNNRLFTCSNNLGADCEISYSTDHGVSWATTVTLTGMAFANGFVAIGSTLTAWGPGVSASYDGGTTWVSELNLTPGNLNAMKNEFGLVLAAGADSLGNGIVYKRYP